MALGPAQKRVHPDTVGIPYDQWLRRQPLCTEEEKYAWAERMRDQKAAMFALRPSMGTEADDAAPVSEQDMQESFLDDSPYEENPPASTQSGKRARGNRSKTGRRAVTGGLYGERD